MTERELALHSCRVYLAEAKRRRKQSFSFRLLEWAAKARKRAAAMEKTPAQLPLI